MTKKYFILIVLCLTLGLTPYVPEPHIVGKIRWIAGGANGMTWLDWWDTVQHGAPWVALVAVGVVDLFKRQGCR